MYKYALLSLVLLSFMAYWFYFSRVNSNCGTVIILNGPSTAGKTSIQKNFQQLMLPSLWVKLGIDGLFDKPMPDVSLEDMDKWTSPNSIRWVETTEDSNKNKKISLFTGVDGEKVAYGMNSAIVAYAKSGCNVIVDYIAYKEAWLSDLQNNLSGIKTIWVKVHAPLETLEEREVSRGTSPKGHARSHYDYVHWKLKYDLEFDSSQLSSAQIAEKIKGFICN